MKDMHATEVSRVVWFKHKYLTNPSDTPEDQIVAAKGRLEKTLTTGVPPQLRNDTVDKLCKLQEILELRMDGSNEREITAPMQQAPIPRQSSRLVKSNNHNPAAVSRVAWEYAMLARVLERRCMDTTDRSSHSNPAVHGNQAELSNSKGKSMRPIWGTSILTRAQRVPRAAWPRTHITKQQ
jgi:hypothetical protein